ncbi:hypothetical protein L9F63_015959, partial [Diploptera punctata]
MSVLFFATELATNVLYFTSVLVTSVLFFATVIAMSVLFFATCSVVFPTSDGDPVVCDRTSDIFDSSRDDFSVITTVLPNNVLFISYRTSTNDGLLATRVFFLRSVLFIFYRTLMNVSFYATLLAILTMCFFTIDESYFVCDRTRDASSRRVFSYLRPYCDEYHTSDELLVTSVLSFAIVLATGLLLFANLLPTRTVLATSGLASMMTILATSVLLCSSVPQFQRIPYTIMCSVLCEILYFSYLPYRRTVLE